MLRIASGPMNLLCVAILMTASAPGQQPTTSTLNPEELVARWRQAVHAPAKRPGGAIVITASDEDGIPGTIEEWTTGEAYRRAVKRAFDQSDVVVAGGTAARRDWNGWVRDVKGQELKRLRSAIWESDVAVFGPPARLEQAEVLASEDGKTLLLRSVVPGGMSVTWYVDAKSWMPVKSLRAGEDSEITTTYEDWRLESGVVMPHRGQVSETDKPTYTWQRTSVQFKNHLAKQTFARPQPGPQDAHLQADAPPIPFTLEANHIVFNASLNGSKPVGFLLDTGADQNVVNETRLAEFGLKVYAKTTTTGGGGSADYSYAQGATLKLPGVELRNQHVAIIDETGLERALGIPLGGLLGYDFISRFVVEIDYEKKLITLHDPKNWKYEGSGAVVPVTFDSGIPFMNGTISVGHHDIPAYLVLDFGAAETMTLTSPFVKANHLVKLAQTNATVNRPAGLENQFFAQNNVRGHIDRMQLGTLAVDSLPVNLSVNVKGAYASATFAGTVGETIYRRYHVFLDYARERVIFEPTAETAKPFPERQTYGLTLLASGADLHTFTVAAVRPGSPAEQDGFKRADVISAVNDKPASQFKLSELRDWLSHAGDHYVLQVMRGRDQLRVPVEVRLVSIDR